MFSPETSVAFSVSLAARTLRRYLQPAHDRYGLYPGRDLVVMEIRRRQDDRPTAAELSATLGMTTSSLSTVLRRAEYEGYVVRLPDPEDRRSLRLALTLTGRVCAEAMAEAWWDAEAIVQTRLGPTRHGELHRLLGQATRALDEVRRAERPLYFTGG